MRLTGAVMLLLLTTLLVAAPYDEPVEELRKLVAKNKYKTVAQFVAALPESIRGNWLPVFDSLSLQHGTRIILSAPDGSLTLSFTLEPEAGYDTVEIKGRSKRTGQFVFAEMDFEQDANVLPSSQQPKERPHYVDGSEFNADIVTKELHGRIDSCSSCHSMGRSRFDLREINARVRAQSSQDADVKNNARRFLQLVREENNPRLKTLTIPSEIKRVAKSDDAGALEKHLLAKARQMHDVLAGVNAQVVATKIIADIKKKPAMSLAMLAVLKNCPLKRILTRAQWNESLSQFHGINAATKSSLEWKRGEPDEKALVAALVRVVRKKQADRSINAEALDDPKSDLDQLARLSFVWNPYNKALLGDSAEPADNHPVGQWGMTGHFVGYFYGGAFESYRDALSASLRDYVARKMNIPAADQSCEKLLEKSDELRAAGMAALPHNRAEPDHVAQ